MAETTNTSTSETNIVKMDIYVCGPVCVCVCVFYKSNLSIVQGSTSK